MISGAKNRLLDVVNKILFLAARKKKIAKRKFFLGKEKNYYARKNRSLHNP